MVVRFLDDFAKLKLDINIYDCGLLKFPTDKRWLLGEEYAFLLKNYRAYQEIFPQDIIISSKGHPLDVYNLPISKLHIFLTKI